MNIKAFFVDALSSALELNIGTPADVLRHVTPEVLAQHLPRPLWARLLTACLGAPRVDARIVVETIGIPNLCEHIPSPIIWTCVAEIAARSLVGGLIKPPPAVDDVSANAPTTPATPVTATQPAPVVAPIGDVINELDGEEQRGGNANRPRSPTNRFRQSNTGVARGGLGSNSRRPQAVAVPPTSLPRPMAGRRSEPEPEPQTSVETSDWASREDMIVAVDDSQLVEWQTDVGSASAITGDDDFSDLGNRKR